MRATRVQSSCVRTSSQHQRSHCLKVGRSGGLGARNRGSDLWKRIRLLGEAVSVLGERSVVRCLRLRAKRAVRAGSSGR